jgi:hypothetical protein
MKKTHCKNGHPLSGDNLAPGNGRICRICIRAAQRAYTARHRNNPEWRAKHNRRSKEWYYRNKSLSGPTS